MFRDKRLKVWKARVSPDTSSGPTGSIEGLDKGEMKVSTRTRFVIVDEVQPEGRSRMGSPDFIRGYRPLPGEVLS